MSRPPRLAVLALVLVLAAALGACGGVQARPEVGSPAPRVRLPDLEGKPVDLADLRGQVVLLNFWALWCDPCKAEMPEFQAAQDRYGPQGFAVVMVDLGDQAKRVAAYVEEQGYRFTTLVDTDLEMAQVYDTRVLPLNVLIDREGTIRFMRVTPFEPGQLAAQLEALIEEAQ